MKVKEQGVGAETILSATGSMSHEDHIHTDR